jgi:hypothetical protein
MQRFLQQKTLKNYRELLAKDRAKTERMFFIKMLARKGAENRRRSARGWLIVQAGQSTCLTDAGRRLIATAR